MDDDARDAAVGWWPEKRIPLSSCDKPLATMYHQARLRPFPGSPLPKHHGIIHKGQRALLDCILKTYFSRKNDVKMLHSECIGVVFREF